jgi:hypothetical protein
MSLSNVYFDGLIRNRIIIGKGEIEIGVLKLIVERM